MVAEKIQALFSFLTIFGIVNNCTAVIANLFLIYLILYRSTQEIGAYRFLLLAFALNDVYFPILHTLTLPVACAHNLAFIMFSDGILTNSVSISLFASAYSQTMPLLSHLFLYRLIALKWPRHLQFYTARNTFLFVVTTVGAEAFTWFYICYVHYGLDQETADYVQPFLDEFFDGESKDLIGGLFYNDKGEFRMRAVLATMGFNVIMTICMSIIVFSTVSLITHFKKTTDARSAKTKRMQLRLFYILCMQLVIPLIVVYFPCAGSINLAMFGYSLSVFPNLACSIASTYPIIDACIVMYGVKCYRKALVSIFHFGSRSSAPVTTISNVHTSQAHA